MTINGNKVQGAGRCVVAKDVSDNKAYSFFYSMEETSSDEEDAKTPTKITYSTYGDAGIIVINTLPMLTRHICRTEESARHIYINSQLGALFSLTDASKFFLAILRYIIQYNK
jgi:hypothetical protein